VAFAGSAAGVSLLAPPTTAEANADQLRTSAHTALADADRTLVAAERATHVTRARTEEAKAAGAESADVAAAEAEVAALNEKIGATDQRADQLVAVIAGTSSPVQTPVEATPASPAADGGPPPLLTGPATPLALSEPGAIGASPAAEPDPVSEAVLLADDPAAQSAAADRVRTDAAQTLRDAESLRERVERVVAVAIPAAARAADRDAAAQATADEAAAAEAAAQAAAAAAAAAAPPPPAPEPTTRFARPSTGKVNSPFGMRNHPISGGGALHSGIDYDEGDGTAYAADSGTVLTVGYQGGYGLAVEIGHADGTTTFYAHLASADVSPGQQVNRGDGIAVIGSTGSSTGRHLHFEVRTGGTALDPAGLVP
jgi:murein DD-endopeptidase MepM/ murein hydrolase activator NlpD